MNKTPYTGFDNKTLSELPKAWTGQKIKCDKCDEYHVLESATNQKGEPTDVLFYKCGKNTYLGSTRGKLLVNTKPDVSGTV